MKVIKKIITLLIIMSLFISEIKINAARGGVRGGGRQASRSGASRSHSMSSRQTSRSQATSRTSSGIRRESGQRGTRRITDTFGTGKKGTSQGKGRKITDTFDTGKRGTHDGGRGHDGRQNGEHGGDWWGPGLAAVGLTGLGIGALTSGAGYSEPPAEQEVTYADVGMETPTTPVTQTAPTTPTEPSETEKIPNLPNLGMNPPNIYFGSPIPFPPEPQKPKQTTTKTRVLLINTLNQALKDPDFNQDFQQFMKTKLGKLVIQDVFDEEKEAKNLINIIKSGQFQSALSGMTPVSGPIGDVMQMTK